MLNFTNALGRKSENKRLKDMIRGFRDCKTSA